MRKIAILLLLNLFTLASNNLVRILLIGLLSIITFFLISESQVVK